MATMEKEKESKNPSLWILFLLTANYLILEKHDKGFQKILNKLRYDINEIW